MVFLTHRYLYKSYIIRIFVTMGNETYNTIFRSIDRMFIAINSLIDKDVKSQVPYQQQIRINSIIRDNITNIRSKNDFIPISIDDKLNTL
jgi:hypothetical protein